MNALRSRERRQRLPETRSSLVMRRHLVVAGGGLMSLGCGSLCAYLIGVLTGGVSHPPRWPYLLFAALLILGGLLYWYGLRADRAGQASPGPGKPGLRIAPRPAFLAGREGLLEDLETELSATQPAGLRVVTLCGLGGAGKTSVAVEFAHRHLSDYAVVWQFAAEEATALRAGFGDLATQLGARGLGDAGDPVAQVHSALAVAPGRWLLIFDNAQDEASVRGVLPPTGNGRVLVTSQNPNWSTGRVIEVPVLSDDIAALFLQDRTGSSDEPAARRLARDLGGLPLALEQAGAFMKATGRDIASYQSMFQERRCDLLRRSEEHTS